MPEQVVAAGRYTGIRFGKMPGRQVAVYDKRADVIAKRKVEWWEIWNAARRAQDKPALDPQDRDGSRVWRFEFRAGKAHGTRGGAVLLSR